MLLAGNALFCFWESSNTVEFYTTIRFSQFPDEIETNPQIRKTENDKPLFRFIPYWDKARRFLFLAP
ncbi:MAG TPA: hypothetical protein DCG69_04770 [Bacteroidales bacterium]|nr:hypothetical protein [Bacteroidales bacterium]